MAPINSPTQNESTVKVAGIPEELKSLPRWACWKYQDRGPNSKPGKPPYNPRTGEMAMGETVRTVSFADALEAFKASTAYEGVSYFIKGGDGIIGIDLDNARDDTNQRIRLWALEIIRELDTYTEVSPSGRGLRLFLRGVLPAGHKNKKRIGNGEIEVYSASKFLTVTGRRLRNFPASVETRQEQIDAFYQEHFGGSVSVSKSHESGILNGWTADDASEPNPAKLKAFLSRNRKAKEIYEGSHEGEQSEAELRLANYAAAARWNPEEIADLLVCFRTNAGMGAKHKGYYEKTVAKALDSDLAKGKQPKAPPKPIATKPRKEPSPVACRSLDEAKAIFREWLYLEDDSVIDLILGMAAGNSLPTDPAWLYLISPPGSGKTELLGSINHAEANTFFLSDLTPNALISGYVDPDNREEDISLLPKLNGKLVVIKDFTTILSKPAESRNQIFSILRDCYDGYSSRSTGTGFKEHKSKFNLIAAVTPEIETEWMKNSPLGERFLTFRLTVKDRDAVARRSLINANREEGMREKLRQAVQSVLAGVPKVIPTTPGPMLEQIIRLSDLLTRARTVVKRDRNDALEIEPQPELGGRVAKQLQRIGQSVALVRNRTELGPAEFAMMKRVAFDSIPTFRRNLLTTLHANQHPRTAKRLAEKFRTSETTVRRSVEDLHVLGLVDKQSNNGKGTAYKLSPSTLSALEALKE